MVPFSSFRERGETEKGTCMLKTNYAAEEEETV